MRSHYKVNISNGNSNIYIFSKFLTKIKSRRRSCFKRYAIIKGKLHIKKDL